MTLTFNFRTGDVQAFAALDPYEEVATDWEEHLINQAVSILLRLKRVPAFEAALFKWIQRQQIEFEQNSLPSLDMMMADLYNADDAQTADLDDEQEAGRTVAALLDQNLLSKLNRYEITLQGRLSSTLRQLEELRARRLREERDG